MRSEQRWPGAPGRATAGLELKRRMLQILKRDALNLPVRWVLLLVKFDIFRIEQRELDNVVNATDIAGLEPRGPPVSLIEGVLPAKLHDLAEALVLERAHAIGRPF